jgi:hypothetical protein
LFASNAFRVSVETVLRFNRLIHVSAENELFDSVHFNRIAIEK